MDLRRPAGRCVLQADRVPAAGRQPCRADLAGDDRRLHAVEPDHDGGRQPGRPHEGLARAGQLAHTDHRRPDRRDHPGRGAGGGFDYYDPVDVRTQYGYTYEGLAAGTGLKEILVTGHIQDPVIWSKLGEVGRSVRSTLLPGPDYGVAVGGYLEVRSISAGQPVVYIAESGGLFRGDPPDGGKPGAPKKPR